MKLSDFFIGSRQLFGFITPGAITISAWMLFNRQHPLDDYLIGSDWVIRLIFFVGLSFVVGYIAQTVAFAGLMKADEALWRRIRLSSTATDLVEKEQDSPEKTRKRRDRVQEEADVLLTDIQNVMTFIKEDLGIENLSPDRVPKYCRNIALEYCTYARYRINELESEINFMVALSVFLPMLSLGWIRFESGVESWIVFALTMIVSLGLWRWRIPEMRRNEKRMWVEKYLILRARSCLLRD